MIDDLRLARVEGRRSATPRPRPRGAVTAAGAVVGLGMGACVGLAVDTETMRALRAPGGVATFLGQLTGLAGAYLMLVMLLLVARIPWVELAAGQDRLLRWHRNLGQWPVYLICLHAGLITIGYAEQDRVGVLHQLRVLIQSYPDVLAAVVALGLILVAAVMSIRRLRQRMRYETWWNAHLYLYLALALAFSHQLANGVSFVGHPLTRAVWAAAWAATAGVVLIFRFVMPAARSLYHGLTVVGVSEEAPGVVSVVCRGRHLDRLNVRGGQFFQWRFLARELWWEPHPYSLSALPRSDMVRVTVKDLGDHSARLRRLRPGTRVAIEGPYGAFTAEARQGHKVLLVGAGVGATPIRSILEHLERDVDVTVLLRWSGPEDRLFGPEFERLVLVRGGRLVELVGPRDQHPLDRRQLAELVPDVASRDVFVCGPQALADRVARSARMLGVPRTRIHTEQFEF